MSGLRTMAAADLLGVTPNILRSWEERFGFPEPTRSQGGQRRYDFAQLESLRRALLETQSVFSAINLARKRGFRPGSPAQLLDAFRRFDEEAADRVLEKSLTLLNVERVVDEVVLPAVELAADRAGGEAEYELARRWAQGWLFVACRAAPYPKPDRTILLFDASDRDDLESLRAQAMELGLRRAGHRTAVLPVDLPPLRLVHAVRVLEPVALVACGPGATPRALERLAHTVRRGDCSAPLFANGHVALAASNDAVPWLGRTTVEAIARLRAHLESRSDRMPEAAG